MSEFWYNVVSHQVEEGPQSDWSKLLGPYASRAEAEQAIAQVQANNERWDEADEDAND
ncbi:SPOR domain-containing protein [Citricoccus nitrophenolicus]|uniref:SPOR domain-containing protein n=1 Tax=Citricoccus nitrophenolicus TaxID=863575 RepID=A0ABV0IMN4_9MICC|nr:SPOR domain-containing protein [Citricoccus sp. I39-566]WMY77606.1 SPOR domain-containing protein [Citricoccus sp. I39-566]